MDKRHFLFAGIAASFLLSSISLAAEQTVTAKIKSIDTDKNTITIDETTLDVSRKTKIIIDGEKATISDLKGKQAKVTYDDALETAISIIVGKEAKTDDEAAVKVMRLSKGSGSAFCASRQGKLQTKKRLKSKIVESALKATPIR